LKSLRFDDTHLKAPESLDLRERRARAHHDRDVACVDVRRGAVDVIGDERATHAAFLLTRGEHEVVHDQLAATVEEIGERLLSIQAVEEIRLLDTHPG
jgi:hypothetical protein